ncbi:hypothetical protein KY342_00295 [Candidatus Woesearchaeota archaeon]|nr:hypothetical protein [Candidatus Woesearchaeota archaeon]
MKVSAKRIAKHVIKTARKPKVSSEEAEVKDVLEDMRKRLERKELDSTSMISNQLKSFEKEREEDVEQSQKKINDVYRLMNTINEKLNRLIEIKTERERRVKELEQKVRTKSDTGQQEILRMEDRLNNMELRFRKIRHQRRYSPAQLERIRRALYSFKRRIEEKKRGVSAEVEEPSEELLFPEMPSEPSEKIRHTMKFEIPAPKKSVPAEEIKPELPSLPSLGEMSKAVEGKEPEIPKVPEFELPPLPKPKKTFWQKLDIMLFGKPKRRF